MASFAKIGLNGKVIEVQSISNEVLQDAKGVEQEKLGIDFLTELTHWPIWKQTSYNTFGNVHKLGGTPFRKNFAGIGMIYDEDRDAFIQPKPFNSWTLNEETCIWEAPVAYPNDGQRYSWNEENQTWQVIDNS
tara:strand:- start:783 stop:1181 length:399 start_codon:yes stop_codon:yes gene_type:complete